MKRLLIIALMLMVGIGAASAQKKEVVALGEEVAQLKARETELQRQVDSLARVCSDNKYIMEQLSTMNTAYESLKSAYADVTESMKTLIEAYAAVSADVKGLSANVNELIGVIATPSVTDYEIAGDEHCGLRLIRQNGKYGYINSRNEIVVAPQYACATDFARGYALVTTEDVCQWYDVGDYHMEGYGNARHWNDSGHYYYRTNNYNGRSNKCGLIDSRGKQLIPCKYDVIVYFSKDLWVVGQNGKYGILSTTTGALIQPVKYDYIDYVNYGRALMKLNGKYGYLDENGKVVIAAQYYDAIRFGTDGNTIVEDTENSKDYIIDRNGNFVRWTTY